MVVYLDDYTALINTMWTWNHASGQLLAPKPVFLTYSFAQTMMPVTAVDDHADRDYFRPLSEAERAVFRQALDLWGEVSGIVFFETPSGLGNIEVGGYDLIPLVSGYAYSPDSGIYPYDGETGLYAPLKGYDYGGKIYLDVETGLDLHTMAHEIGHALGLEHPHDGDPPLLNPRYDTGDNTIMSYNDTFPYLGGMDIEAIQRLYGTPEQKGTQVAEWNWEAQTLTLTQKGSASAEILHGTGAHDVIYTQGGADVVVTRGGNDFISVGGRKFAVAAGSGFDSVQVDFAAGALTDVARDQDIVHLLTTDASVWGDMVLMQIERVMFTDSVLAFDVDGTAGQAYRLYQAAFAREPDRPGLGFWIEALDAGRGDLGWAARNFIASDEFTALYGSDASVSDTAFVGLIYENVLQRSADGGGFDFWVGELASGMERDSVLTHFSESDENKANVAAQIEDGIWFV